MLNFGPQELLIILVIALLVVGPQRLPELARSIGRWMRELRTAQEEIKGTVQVGLDEPNGDASAPPTSRPAAASRPPAPDGSTPPSIEQSSTPTVSANPTADEVRDISRSLGRSLGQIRRAREEVQRSFRVDLDAPMQTPPSKAPAPPPTGSSVGPPSEGPMHDVPPPESPSDDPAS